MRERDLPHEPSAELTTSLRIIHNYFPCYDHPEPSPHLGPMAISALHKFRSESIPSKILNKLTIVMAITGRDVQVCSPELEVNAWM
jgi:hypothetical protein